MTSPIFTANIQVIGIKETLRELQKLNPELRKSFNNQYKAILEPTVAEIRSRIPSEAPLSGFERPYKKNGPWMGGKVQKGVKTKIDTRRAKPSDAEITTAFAIIQRTGWGAIFDMAGRSSTNMLATNLGRRYGVASRSMWPSVINHQDQIESDMSKLADDVMTAVAQEIASF
jgi:hypothetical protein